MADQLLLRWVCPECSYVSWWLGSESGEEDRDVLAPCLNATWKSMSVMRTGSGQPHDRHR